MANTIEYVFTTKKALLVWSEARLPSLEINPKVFKFFSSPRVLSLEINIQRSCNQKLFCGDLKYQKWLSSHFLCMNPASIFVFSTRPRIFDSQWSCLSKKVFIQGNVRTVFHFSNWCFIKLMFISMLLLTWISGQNDFKLVSFAFSSVPILLPQSFKKGKYNWN